MARGPGCDDEGASVNAREVLTWALVALVIVTILWLLGVVA